MSSRYSRWMDYDADNECIIGFNDDGHENYRITTNGSSFDYRNLSPISLGVELIGDVFRRKDKELIKQKEKENKSKESKHCRAASRPYIYTNNNTKNPRLEMKVEPISPYATNIKYGYGMTMAPQQYPRTPSPVSPQSPAIHNGYHYNNINYNQHSPTTPKNGHSAFPQFKPQQQRYVQQQVQKEVTYKTGTDMFDIYNLKKKEQKGLTFGSTETSTDGEKVIITAANADTVTRTTEYDGERLEAYGKEVIDSESYSWKFILYGKTSMIVALIDAEVDGPQSIDIYFNTKNEIMDKYLYQNGKPRDGMVIEVMYNVRDKCMIVKNISGESHDKGKSFKFKENIDTTKKYRLSVLLDKPGTVTLF